MAGERAFELFAERAARLEDQRLDTREHDAEDLGDLRVRALLDLSHDQHRAQLERQQAERAADVVLARAIRLGNGLVDALRVPDLVDPRRAARALLTQVVRDPDQPGVDRPRSLSALV